jgi:hypothetical protein
MPRTGFAELFGLIRKDLIARGGRFFSPQFFEGYG